MIVLRTKQFIAPLIAAAGGPLGLGIMGGGAAISAYQGHQQNKEMERQGEEQQKAAEKQADLIKTQNKELGKIAERVKSNPSAVSEVPGILQKSYSAPINLKGGSKFLKSVGSAAKSAFSSGAKDNIKIGAAVAGTTYLGSKFIQHDMKKNNLDIDSESGMLIPKSYSIPGKILSTVNKNKGTIAMGGLLGGVPLVLGYAADKKQAKDQISSTQQKQYSLSGIGRSIAKGWKTFKSHPSRTITGAASNFASFGIGGTKNVQKFGTELVKSGGKNGSDLALSVGKWIGNHKTAANALSVLPGALAAKVTWDGATKLGDNIGQTVDPNAYKYKKVKDQLVQN